MTNELLSSSDRYLKKSNRIVLIVGIIFAFIFIIGLLALIPMGDDTVKEAEPSFSETVDPFAATTTVATETDILAPVDPTANLSQMDTRTKLEANPSTLSLGTVALGTRAESVLTLVAIGGKVKIGSMGFLGEQERSFTFDNRCEADTVLSANSTCNVVISWRPDEARTLQNNFVINWTDESVAHSAPQKTIISVNATAADASLCGVCEPSGTGAGKFASSGAAGSAIILQKGRLIFGFEGKILGYVNDEGKALDQNDTHLGTLDGRLVKDGSGTTIGVAEPEKIPVSMDGKVLGRIMKDGAVIDDTGKNLGKVLGDGTIITPSLNVIGSAIELAPVINGMGSFLGTVSKDASVLDDKGAIIGTVLGDKRIVSTDGNVLGFVAPSGIIAGATGAPIGIVMPDATVQGTGDIVGRITPTGVAVYNDLSVAGKLLPSGVAVGGGCQTLGAVLPDGTLVDAGGRQIGKADIDGTVSNLSGLPIGKAIKGGVFLDAFGAPAGYIGLDGKAMGGTGASLGCAMPDGTVINGQAQVIGMLPPKGLPISYTGGSLGFTLPDYSVASYDGDIIGKVMPKGEILSPAGAKIGKVVTSDVALSSKCGIVGAIGLDGALLNSASTKVFMNGEVADTTASNALKGYARQGGTVVSFGGQMIGTVRLNGEVFDKDNIYAGCLSTAANGAMTSGSSAAIKGSVLPRGTVISGAGENVGWIMADGTVADEHGMIVGKMTPSGTALDAAGVALGKVAPAGIAISPAGKLLGSAYFDSGVTDSKGTVIGKRLGNVILSRDGKIIGGFIKAGSAAVNLAGKPMGIVTAAGEVLDASSAKIGTLSVSGAVISPAGEIVGGVVSPAFATDFKGDVIGEINEAGQFVKDGAVAGFALAGGLVANSSMEVVGRALPDFNIAFDATGRSLGYIDDKGAYYSRDGEQLGKATSGKVLVSLAGEVIGDSVPVSTISDLKAAPVAAATLGGEVKDFAGKDLGKVMPDGSAIYHNNTYLGKVAQAGIFSSIGGAVSLPVSWAGIAYDAKGNPTAAINSGNLALATDGKVLGGFTAGDIALGNKGAPIGFVGFDGLVYDSKGVIGKVLPSGSILAVSGRSLIGKVATIGASAISDSGYVLGLVRHDGKVVSGSGSPEVGYALAGGVVTDKSMNPLGAVVEKSPVLGYTGNLAGFISATGKVTSASGIVGTLTAAGEVFNDTGLVAGKAKSGLAFSSLGGVIGLTGGDGKVIAFDGTYKGTALPYGAIADKQGALTGSVLPLAEILDNAGNFIGFASAVGYVNGLDGKEVGRVLPSGFAVDGSGATLGGIVSGKTAVDDKGVSLGSLNPDGSVLGRAGLIGKALPDGTVISYNEGGSLVPYLGKVLKTGIVSSAEKSSLGILGLSGKVTDARGNILATSLDDGTIIDNDSGIIGKIIPFGAVMNTKGDKQLGLPLPSGIVVGLGAGAAAGDNDKGIGIVLPDGTVIDNSKMTVGYVTSAKGSIIKSACQVSGYASGIAAGVISTTGVLAGCVDSDSFALDKTGAKAGLLVPSGAPVISTEGTFLGRVLTDGIVIDRNGQTIGCLDLNGNVVDASGKVIGTLLKRGMLVDASGKYLGRVLFGGTVIDASGKVIGTATADGRVVDASGRILGDILTSIVVRGSDGFVIGVRLPSGKVIDPLAGRDIGRISLGTEISGNTLSPYAGRLVADMTGDITGIVNPNGRVFDILGKEVGSLDALGLVKNTQGTVVAFIPADTSNPYAGATAYNMMGALLGTVTEDGSVRSSEGITVGDTGINGTVLSSSGEVIGYVPAPAVNPFTGLTAYSAKGTVAGTVDAKGGIYGKDGILFGTADKNGIVRSSAGRVLGFVPADSAAAFMDSDVQSLDGKTIGKVAAGGEVIGPSGTSIGSIDTTGIAKNYKGEIIGFVPSGKNEYYALNGTLLGTVGADGKLTSADGKPSEGKVANGVFYAASGKAVGFASHKVGSPYAGRSVLNAAAQSLGNVNDSGVIVTATGATVGTVDSLGIARNGSGVVIGFVPAPKVSEFTGLTAYNAAGKTLGTVAEDGALLDASGRAIGKVNSVGLASGDDGKAMGFVPEIVLSGLSGLKAYDASGNVLGIITEDGTAIAGGKSLGKADGKSLIKSAEGKTVGFVPVGAASPRAGLIGKNVLSPAGTSLGTISRDGAVRQSGRTVGAAEISGRARDLQGKKMGISANSAFSYADAMRLVGRPITDKTENYMGIVWEDGTARDALGRSVGTVYQSGVVVDKQGNVLGATSLLDEEANALVDKVAYDQKGDIIGQVRPDGMVYSSDGKIVGRVTAGGKVLDLQGTSIGIVPKTNIVVDGDLKMKGIVEPKRAIFDARGRVVGFVNNKGEVTDLKGNILAAGITKDGGITNASGKVIGALKPTEFIMDNKGNPFGFIDGKDGSVYSTNAEKIGQVDNSGTVTDNAGKIIGFIRKPAFDITKEVRSASRTSEVVFSPIVGQRVYDINANQIGKVDNTDGAVVDMNGKVIGKRLSDGKVADSSGNIIGYTGATTVYTNQKVFNAAGEVIGTLDKDGMLVKSGKIIGRILADGSAVDFTEKVLGGAGYSAFSGQKAYDTSDSIIGTIDKDGMLRDVYGNLNGRAAFDGTVYDMQGIKIGKVKVSGAGASDMGTPSGVSFDAKGSFMGRAISPTVFDNLGAFGDYGNKVLGKGGGFGPGERYNSDRVKQISRLQQERRASSSWGKFSAPNFPNYGPFKDKDWSRVGFEKNLSTRPVDMNRVIVVGKAIPAVLVNTVDSRFTEVPVTAVVERNIYASDGRNIIIPAGSWLVGRSEGSGEMGGYVAKVQISWERLIRPDGVAFALSANSGDAMGRGGVPGYLDRRLFDKYFTPLISEIMADAVTIAMASSKSSTIADSGAVSTSDRQQAYEQARDSWTDTTSQIVQQIIRDYTNIATVITIPSGTRLTAFAQHDLWLITPEEVASATAKDIKNKGIPLIAPEGSNIKTGGGAAGTTYYQQQQGGALVSGGTGAGSLVGTQPTRQQGVPLIAPANTSTSYESAPVYTPPTGATYTPAQTGSGSAAGGGTAGHNTSAPASVPRLF